MLDAREDGLEMQGLPDGAGLDVLRLKGETQVLAGEARSLGIDGQTGEPTGRLTPGGLGLHDEARQAGEGSGILH